MLAVAAGLLLIGVGLCWESDACPAKGLQTGAPSVSFAADGAPSASIELTAAKMARLPDDCVVMVFSPSCGPCKATKPKYIEAASSGKSRVPLLLGDITQPHISELAKKLNVQGVPHIARIKKGQQVAVYSGPRTAESFVAFAQ